MTDLGSITWEDVPGWFDFQDIYDAAIARASDGARFVECGVYMGRSTVYMAQKIKDSGKAIAFDAVDDFNAGFQSSARMFWSFAKFAGVDAAINLREMEQLSAASTYDDRSLDFVFLDSDHTYEGTKAAILAFLPKMKPGAVLGGHDCEVRGNFPGVILAVRECLPGFRIVGRSFVYEVPA